MSKTSSDVKKPAASGFACAVGLDWRQSSPLAVRVSCPSRSGRRALSESRGRQSMAPPGSPRRPLSSSAAGGWASAGRPPCLLAATHPLPAVAGSSSSESPGAVLCGGRQTGPRERRRVPRPFPEKPCPSRESGWLFLGCVSEAPECGASLRTCTCLSPTWACERLLMAVSLVGTLREVYALSSVRFHVI